MNGDTRWFDEHTASAPQRLRERAGEILATTPAESGRVTQLANAGRQALDAAIVAGSARGAALDLLAADALITLALLAASEDDPASLGATARALRLRDTA